MPAGETFAWDALNLMEKRGSGIFHIYSADDERMLTVDARQDGWLHTWTLRDLDGKPLREYTLNGCSNTTPTPQHPEWGWKWSKDWIWFGGKMLASESPAGLRYFALDHLGTPIQVLRPDGSAEETNFYFPYGERLGGAGAANAEKLKFTGHERDFNGAGVDDDLDYMHARYYSPTWGRFLSVDPTRSAQQAIPMPQLWNRLSYAAGNPVGNSDPSGRVVNLGSLSPANRALLMRQLQAKTGIIFGYSEQSGQLLILGMNGGGSKTARRDVISAMASSKTFYAVEASSPKERAATNIARNVRQHTFLDFGDISQIDASASHADTFDAAMIYLHELKHAQGLHDPTPFVLKQRAFAATKGETVEHMNRIRDELGLPTRGRYSSMKDSNGRHYLPFADGKIYIPGAIDK